MAGDCPHRSQLQGTIKQCPDQTAIIGITHGNYLAIIDELNNELDSLSCEVSVVQQEFNKTEQSEEQQDQAFQTILKALESQNDLLQAALEQTTKQKDDTCSQLEQNNDTLKCQIDHLQRTNMEKEKCIAQLNTIMMRLSPCCPSAASQQHKNDSDQEVCALRSQLDQANRRIESLLCDHERSQKQERLLLSETRKLNDELIESKRKSGDLNCNTRRLTNLLKSQEANRIELSKKYECMEQNYEDQAKKLRAASIQLNFLQERFTSMDKRHDEHNMERNLLREEVLSLKEKEATLLGKQKSIQEQFLKTEKELFTAHNVIKEQQSILQRNEFAHKEIVKRLQEAINENKRKLNGFTQDYKHLQESMEKESECRQQNEKLLESFRKWKEEQIKADEATRTRFKLFEEHIQMLLEEKQKFLEQYRALHRDYTILQNELGRLKVSSFSTSAPVINTSDNSVSQRMELLRRTSRRISEQNNSLRDGSTSRGGIGTMLTSQTEQQQFH